MKKLSTLLISLFIALTVITAQEAPPQAFSFKALIKDYRGSLIILRTVSLRISILQNAPNGPVVYCETFRVQTNANAQVDIEIGRGTVVTGIFSAIDWGADEYFIKVEVDVKGGTNYKALSVAQLLSVPYALYAGNFSGGQDNDDDPQNELISDAYLSGSALTIVEDGRTTIIELSGLLSGVDASTTNELQNLSINGHELHIENGNTITLPDEVNDADADPANEIQAITLEGNNLILTTNHDPIIIDLTPYLDNTDNQTLAFDDHQLSISNGNTIPLPDNVDDADADPLNEIQQLSILGDRISLSREGGYVDIPVANTVNGIFVYGDRDKDGYGDPFKALWIPVNVSPPSGYISRSDDCNDENALFNPGVSDICDGKDNNCNGLVDEDCLSPEYYNLLIAYFTCLQTHSCQYDDPSCIINNCQDEVEEIINSGEEGVCISGLLMNWSQLPFDESWTIEAMANYLVLQCVSPDNDHDGYSVPEVDCDDNNPAINPGAEEICEDGIDQNCNGVDPECGDGDEDGYTVAKGDCNDGDPSIHPGATDLCDQKDNDCDGQTDEDAEWIIYYRDDDRDNYGDPGVSQTFCSDALARESGYVPDNRDCNDNDAEINPGIREDEENCDDGIDQDCNGSDLVCSDLTDDDQDGYSEADGDCDDNNFEVNPGVTEICADGIDQNCDGIDPPANYCTDDDGDNYTEVGGDCDDGNPDVYPGAEEVCDDGIDQNCDGRIDEGCCVSVVAQLLTCMDENGCSYSDPLCVTQKCLTLYYEVAECIDVTGCVLPLLADPDLPFDETWDNMEKAAYICSNCGAVDTDGDGFTPNSGDCDDSDPSVYPGATEICEDGIDQDCNGHDASCNDKDEDGFLADEGDCDDNDPEINPGAPEICDGKDNNCDGQRDEEGGEYWFPDTDGDGFGSDLDPLQACVRPDGYVEIAEDCDDSNPAIYPEAPEICDGFDNDCDGEADEDLEFTWYFLDQDGDGFGSAENMPEGPEYLCYQPENHVDNDFDCDDNNPDVNPGATEICGDEIDQDCDGADLLCPGDTDDDRDGFTENQGDCNDDDPSINPWAEEICGDGIDQNCDGTDLSCLDVDNDGDGFTENQGDCNDDNDLINPEAEEMCGDGIDQNCDGTDLSCLDVDNDRDSFTENQGDCNDYDYSIYPGAEEICDDGIDQNCDGTDLSCLDVDNDGDSFTENQGDCDDFDPGINPAIPEICGDGIDQDCDGSDPECLPTIKMVYPSSLNISLGGSATVYIELVNDAPYSGVTVYAASNNSECLTVTPVITIDEAERIGNATVTGLCTGIYNIIFTLGSQQVSMTVTVE